MRNRRSDWLDAVAMRLAGGGSAPTPSLETPNDDDHLSRARALKLAGVGAASLTLGLWRTSSPARAQGQEGCFTWCFDAANKRLNRRLASCDDVFKPSTFGGASWRKVLTVNLFPPATQVQWGAAALTGLCYAKARFDSERDKVDCYDQCEDRCRKRAAESRSRDGRLSTPCDVTPPPKLQSPKPPPAPNSTQDPCLACAQVGGMCCGPFKAGADGRFVPCACANPSVGCERYGCGG